MQAGSCSYHWRMSPICGSEDEASGFICHGRARARVCVTLHIRTENKVGSAMELLVAGSTTAHCKFIKGLLG